ncbi:hypothetical protein B484DRAFT_402804 [Ochromonadaceae sp. CCMP2298]|nr:hypothetical protein B484DRAFT_402804 [Ochromonadaceae sp. CCMP2298]
MKIYSFYKPLVEGPPPKKPSPKMRSPSKMTTLASPPKNRQRQKTGAQDEGDQLEEPAGSSSTADVMSVASSAGGVPGEPLPNTTLDKNFTVQDFTACIAYAHADNLIKNQWAVYAERAAELGLELEASEQGWAEAVKTFLGSNGKRRPGTIGWEAMGLEDVGGLIRVIIEVDGPHHFRPFSYGGAQSQEVLQAKYEKDVQYDLYKEKHAVGRRWVLLRVPWHPLMDSPQGSQEKVHKWLRFQIDKAIADEIPDRKGRVRCYPSLEYMDKEGGYRRARGFKNFNNGEEYEG